MPTTTVPEPPFVAATLAWCNERRAEQGKQPLERLPLGKIDDPRSCPCGLATGLYVEFRNYTDSQQQIDEGRAMTWPRLPEFVTTFVLAFDNGALPQYRDPSDFPDADEEDADG